MKRFLPIFVLLCMLLPVKVQAAMELPEALFLQQQDSDSCTLCASTMLIRSCLYIHGSDSWQNVTETDVADSAWTYAGLSWDWQYTVDENKFTLAHTAVNGMDRKTLEDILKEHPEGIMLYCGGNAHHGVLVFDCQDDTVYCADPAVGFSGKRIALCESLLGQRLGSQDNILDNVTAYWYIRSSEIVPDSSVREAIPLFPPFTAQGLTGPVPQRM